MKSIGLNVGLWLDQPTADKVSFLRGNVVDIPIRKVKPAVIRFMVLQEGTSLTAKRSEFTTIGYSVGVLKGPGPGFGLYRRIQYLLGVPPVRVRLTISNITDGDNQPGTSSIAGGFPSVLQLSLKNASNQIITVPPASTMKINMPAFFSVASLSNSLTAPPHDNWAVGSWGSDSKMILTYTGTDTYDWQGDTSLVVTISNLKTEATTPPEGKIVIKIPQANPVNPVVKRKNGVTGQNQLTLIPFIAEATITSWTTHLAVLPFCPTSMLPVQIYPFPLNPTIKMWCN